MSAARYVVSCALLVLVGCGGRSISRADADAVEPKTLDWFHENIVGTWAGTRTTPWQAGALPVILEFTEDGTWSGECASDDACPVLYYGSDEETSENTYQFTRVNNDGYAHGRIILTWLDAGNTEGELRDLRFEANETRLLFDFWATWAGEYGPISFELTRR